MDRPVLKGIQAAGRRGASLTRALGLLLFLSLPAAGPAQMTATIAIDPALDRRPISPLIYGTNGQDMQRLEAARRLGGNRLTAYNWENNFSNAGNDYNYSNDHYLPWALGIPPNHYYDPAVVYSAFHDSSLARGAYTLLTAPMLGWVSRDGNGPCAVWDSLNNRWIFNQRPPGPRWRQIVNAKGAPFTLDPDTSDPYVYSDEMLNLILTRYGPGSGSTGVKAWALDNEPDLWASTHAEIKGDTLTYHELFAKSVDLAQTLKRMDVTAEVYGPVLSGFYGYYRLSDAPDHGRYPAYDTTHYPFLCAYLDSFRLASQGAGQRLLDVLDLHWYPENNEGGGNLRGDDTSRAVAIDRMQRPRAMWDSTYVEPTWIGHWFSPVSLIPNLRHYIGRYFPGTKIAFTEYTWYADDHISGGIAQADFFGVAGRYGLYMADRWYDIKGWARAAFRLYRNVDGQGGTYGDVAVRATTSDVRNAPAYASFLAADSSRLHLVLINRSYDSTVTDTVRIAGPRVFDAGTMWILGRQDSFLHQQALPPIANNCFALAMPPMQACHIILWRSQGVQGGAVRSSAQWFDVHPVPDPFVSFATVPGHEGERFVLYDISGRMAGAFKGDRIGEGLAPGVYFIRAVSGATKPLRIVKLR